MGDPPRYTIYELLEALVERTGWQSEAQKLDMLDVVTAAKANNALGVIGTMMACSHHNTSEKRIMTGHSQYSQLSRVCDDCGRIVG